MHVLGKCPRFPVKTAGPELVTQILLALVGFFSPTDLLIKCILEKQQQIDLDTEIAMFYCIRLCMFRYRQHMVAPPPQPTFSSPSLIKID